MCAISFQSTLSRILHAVIKAKDDWPGEYVVIFDTVTNIPAVRACSSLGRISAMALSHRSPGRTLLAVNSKAFNKTEGRSCHQIAVWDVTPPQAYGLPSRSMTNLRPEMAIPQRYGCIPGLSSSIPPPE
jgi:hypothetical protein